MPSKAPKVLFITSFWPFPETDGGRNVTASILRAIKKTTNPTVVTYIQEDVFKPQEAHLQEFKDLPIYLVKWTRAPRSRMLSFWTHGKSYYFYRDYSERFLSTVVELIKSQRFTHVIIDKAVPLVFAPHIRKVINRSSPRPKFIFFSHNVESNLIKDYIVYASGIKKLTTLPLYLELFLAQKNEKYFLQQFDLVTSISQKDAQTFKSWGIKNVETYPPGFFKPDFVTYSPGKTPTIKILSNLKWYPNLEGILRFLKKTWPIIYAKAPNAQFVIAGKNAPEVLKKAVSSAPGVSLAGFIPEDKVKEFFRSATLAIAPIWMGSGIKIKILRNLQMGIPTISTTKGLEGLPAGLTKTIPNTDDPERLALLILKYLLSNKEAKLLREKQIQAYLKYADVRQLEDYITQLLKT